MSRAMITNTAADRFMTSSSAVLERIARRRALPQEERQRRSMCGNQDWSGRMVLTRGIPSSSNDLLRSNARRRVNKVIRIGNATLDAELRHTQTGKAVSSIRLATNRTGKDEKGKQRTVAEIVADDVQFLSRRGMEAEVSPRWNRPLL